MRQLISYDIRTADREGQRRLSRVAALMERYGVRVQKSVFECALGPDRLEKLLYELEQVICFEEDSILVYRMGHCCSGKVIRLGIAPPEPFDVAAFVL